jgi:hypothetical protein
LSIKSIEIENTIEFSYKGLGKSKWKRANIRLVNKEEIFIIFYCSNTFTLETKAAEYALIKRLEIRQLKYTIGKLGDSE